MGLVESFVPIAALLLASGPVSVWGVTLGIIVILVGCYYGYTSSGGPVGVGKNTAKSMLVNMVLVSVVGLIAQQIFWGGYPNAPIAN